MKSGRLYSLVTKYWPRIAAGLVVGIGLLEFIVGGLTADSGLEFYLLAWAATTAGLWFMAEKGETSLSDDSRGQITAWIAATDFEHILHSIPTQFSILFDRVFGKKHWSRRCFNRSCAASLVSFLLVCAAGISLSPSQQSFGLLVVALGPVVLLNFVPDYFSLLETRWAIQFMERGGQLCRMLLLDALATAAISIAGMVLVPLTLVTLLQFVVSLPAEGAMDWSGALVIPSLVIEALTGVDLVGRSWAQSTSVPDPDEFFFIVRVAFLSAFFTSVWLWLYAVSVLMSRVLLKMNDGVGFLLRVTDVENQPFRSMGFVSVLIVSGLFLLGLPLVLL